MRIVFESDTEQGKFGIMCDGNIEYEADFDSEVEAKLIAAAHDNGALTYEAAIAQLERVFCMKFCDIVDLVTVQIAAANIRTKYSDAGKEQPCHE